MSSLSYWLEIFFSSGIATFGLVENSPAVIIGAMLISPLMGPIMGTGLALAIGDLYLGAKALLNLVVSIAASIAISGFLVWLLPFHSATSEIIARTNPNLLDLGIALLSGLAGSVVVSRGSGEGVTALPGVAIAVALMPPLCAVGFGLGSGINLDIMGGAGLLFLTNLVAIVASAFLVFLLVGLKTAEVETAMATARGNETRASLARLLLHTRFGRMLTSGGRLQWRILIVLILLGAIAVPLRTALIQVTRETLAREAVEAELKRLEPSDAVVSQQVSITSGGISIRLFSTKPVSNADVSSARQDLMRRTRQNVQISVETVASTRELSDLMERLDRPAPAVVKEATLADLQTQVLARVRPAIQDIWPSAQAPIQDFDVAVDELGAVVVEIHYLANKDIGDIAVQMAQQSLRSKLGMDSLTLTAKRTSPPRPQKVPPAHAGKSPHKH